MKKLYVVRHCQAEGQHPEAQLTDVGKQQSLELAEFFSKRSVQSILSSPYQRAIQSIQPLAEQLGIEIQLDKRLSERVLSTVDDPDWLEKLKATYEDVHLKFPGGESSQEAMDRIVSVVDELLKSDDERIIIVTHGNIMSLLLHYFDQAFGFEQWKTLSNPDVYLLTLDHSKASLTRIWG